MTELSTNSGLNAENLSLQYSLLLENSFQSVQNFAAK